MLCFRREQSCILSILTAIHLTLTDDRNCLYNTKYYLNSKHSSGDKNAGYHELAQEKKKKKQRYENSEISTHRGV